MLDSTFQQEIDRNLDRIGDACDIIIDCESKHPTTIARNAEKIISLAKRIMRLATAENENGTDNSRSR